MKRYLEYDGLKVLAHRGGAEESFENTLESFEYSQSIGCEFIETDVQASSDGVPYIFHDDDLKRILNRRIYECSEGQKRRVGLSRLSIDDKKVLLLDEPTTSLDIENVSRLKNYLKDHQKKGGIAIVASHEAFISSNNQDIILTLNPPKNSERDPFI